MRLPRRVCQLTYNAQTVQVAKLPVARGTWRPRCQPLTEARELPVFGLDVTHQSEIASGMVGRLRLNERGERNLGRHQLLFRSGLSGTLNRKNRRLVETVSRRGKGGKMIRKSTFGSDYSAKFHGAAGDWHMPSP